MELAELNAGILKETNKDYAIIHSVDGFDEISLKSSYRRLWHLLRVWLPGVTGITFAPGNNILSTFICCLSISMAGGSGSIGEAFVH